MIIYFSNKGSLSLGLIQIVRRRCTIIGNKNKTNTNNTQIDQNRKQLQFKKNNHNLTLHDLNKIIRTIATRVHSYVHEKTLPVPRTIFYRERRGNTHV